MPVDFIYTGKPLKETIGDKWPLDYVIASHVIEHVPDLVGWLKDIHEALRPGGALALWVPDKRFTFDAHRRISSHQEIALAHSEKRTRPSLRVIMDHFTHVCALDCYAAWTNYNVVSLAEYAHGPEFLELATDDFVKGNYIDVHAWVFTPWHFLEIIGWIVNEYNIPYDLSYFETTPEYDLQFRVQLVKPLSGKSSTYWHMEANKQRNQAKWPKDGEQISRRLGLAF
jgi:SAM-dependent methyltransferase